MLTPSAIEIYSRPWRVLTNKINTSGVNSYPARLAPGKLAGLCVYFQKQRADRHGRAPVVKEQSGTVGGVV